MNLVSLLFIFLFIRSSYEKCRSKDPKLLLRQSDCVCSDLLYSPKGRIFNGTELDRRDALYVAALYILYRKEDMFRKLHLLKVKIFYLLIF